MILAAGLILVLAPLGGYLLAVRATRPVAEIINLATRLRPGSLTELRELQLGKAADAPLCMTCGTKMRPAGSCYVCEGCGSTSGCS